MKDPFRVAAPLMICLCLCLVASAIRSSRSASAGVKHWVCPPCNLPCDDAVFDKPGTCPSCGMALVDQESVSPAPQRRKVAILIFNNVEIIDYTGPWEIFGDAGFDVYSVAATKSPVTTAMGMTVVPKYTFADAPQPEILLVPGGGIQTALQSAETLKWVTETTARTVHTMSVCNGAFILAKAGLLDGLTATTTWSNIERLSAQYPKIKVVDDRRFVDNGRIITTAGLSAGIDGALHVVSKMLGNGVAQKVALDEEVDWRPTSGFARAALADRLIPDVDMDALGKWEIVSTQGDTDRWEIVMQGSSKLSAAELMDHVGGELTKGKWTGSNPAGAGATAAGTSQWKFSGRDGKPWTGTLTIETIAGQDHRYSAKLTIGRLG